MEENKSKNGFVDALKEFYRRDLVQYIIKRILWFIPTLLLISILVFFVIQLPPGDYVSAHIAALATEGELVDADYAASMREDYGLDLPVWQQYLKWVKDIIWTPTDSAYYRLYHSHHNWKYVCWICFRSTSRFYTISNDWKIGIKFYSVTTSSSRTNISSY